MFVAEYEIRLPGTHADIKCKISMLIQLITLFRQAKTQADSSTQMMWRDWAADITHWQ